jgi:hypothetical protein
VATSYHQIIVLIAVAVVIAACATRPTPTPLAAVPPTPTVTVAAPTSPAPTAAPTVTVAAPTSPAPTAAPTVALPTEPARTDTPVPSTIAPSTPLASSSANPDGGVEQVVGTVVRFSAGSTSVEVTIGEDNPAVRDFLLMLPLTLTLEELVGREKIAYLPRKLVHAGSPGSDPEDGDLIYYVPWGNIGFYYNTAGIGYSDQTIHLGTYDASLEQLEQLAGQDVIVEVVR